MPPTLKYQNVDIASVTAVKFSGSAGFGVSVLTVQVEAVMQPMQAVHGVTPPRIITLGGRLMSVAPLIPKQIFWECVSYASDQAASLEAFLSNAQVRALDEARDAQGDFVLNVSLEAQVAGGKGVTPSTINMPAKVTGSDWSRILSEMKFEDRATFEVPIGGGRVGPPFEKAAAFVKAALDKVQQRQWADAMTQCREALGELQQHQTVQTPPWADWGDLSKRNAWGNDARLVATQTAVRHMTHVGPHAAIGNVDEHTVRLTVTLTGALLRYYASR